MPTARSEAELYQMLAGPLQKATDYVVQKIWNENREIVRVVVYEAYHPKAYNRSGEFKRLGIIQVEVIICEEALRQQANFITAQNL